MVTCKCGKQLKKITAKHLQTKYHLRHSPSGEQEVVEQDTSEQEVEDPTEQDVTPALSRVEPDEVKEDDEWGPLNLSFNKCAVCGGNIEHVLASHVAGLCGSCLRHEPSEVCCFANAFLSFC